jgi:hypothetical protein
MWTAGRIVLALILGAIGGVLADQIHVQFDVLFYPRPDPGLFGQPWWVGPQFGVATIVMLAACAPFARAARPRTEETYLGPIPTGAIWFAAAYLASGVFDRWPEILTAAYGVTFIGRVAPRRDRVPVILFAILLAIGGPVYEAILSSQTGLFHYIRGEWVVPIWLPGLYAHGAPLAIAIAQRMQRRNS